MPAYGRQCSTERAAETPKVGISRVLVKASPAFGRRRLLKNHGLYCFCPRVVLPEQSHVLLTLKQKTKVLCSLTGHWRPTTEDPEILREQIEIEFEQKATSNKQIVRQWLTWFRGPPHRILKLVESGLTPRREQRLRGRVYLPTTPPSEPKLRLCRHAAGCRLLPVCDVGAGMPPLPVQRTFCSVPGGGPIDLQQNR